MVLLLAKIIGVGIGTADIGVGTILRRRLQLAQTHLLDRPGLIGNKTKAGKITLQLTPVTSVGARVVL